MDGKRQTSITVNYIFNTIQQMSNILLPLITAPYISRVLNPSGIGAVSYVTANVTYFTLIGMMGISGYGQREIAIVREDKYKTSKLFWELEILHLVVFLFTLVGYVILIALSDKYQYLYVINLFSIFSVLIDISWFYHAYERYRFLAIRNCIIKLIYTVCIFIFVKKSDDIGIYVLLSVLAGFVGNLLLLPSLKTDLICIDFKTLQWKRHFREVLIYFVPTIAASVYSLLDKSVINWLTHSDEQNGYYEQALKILNVFNSIIHSLATVSAARMTILLADNRITEARNRMSKSLQLMLMMAMPCAWGIIGIADRFVPIFLGEGYEEVVILLYILMPLTVILGFSVYTDGMYLVPSGQRGKSAMAVCMGAIINFFANIILVYFKGARGAALATLITETLITVIMVFMSRKILIVKDLVKSVLKYGILGIVVFFIVRIISLVVKNDFFCLILQVTSAVCFYFSALLIIKDEIVLGMISEFLKKIRRNKKYSKIS